MTADGTGSDKGGWLWGKEQVVPLRAKALSEPDEISWQPYPSGQIINGHIQYNTIVLCRVKMVNQHLTKPKQATCDLWIQPGQ